MIIKNSELLFQEFRFKKQKDKVFKYIFFNFDQMDGQFQK